jgi:hypothetical protein
MWTPVQLAEGIPGVVVVVVVSIKQQFLGEDSNQCTTAAQLPVLPVQSCKRQ